MPSRIPLYFCTLSNMEQISFGDSVNDNKIIQAIPSKYHVSIVHPKYSSKNEFTLKGILKFALKQIALSFGQKKIFICRQNKAAFLPILFRSIFRHRVIINVHCTPLAYMERESFRRNPEITLSDKRKFKIIEIFEKRIEHFIIHHADHFIVENEHAEYILKRFGINSTKITIIPYYVHDYFLIGSNPSFLISKKEEFILGYTGRFRRYDKLTAVIDAVNLVIKDGFNVHLNLIGDGPTKKSIMNRVSKLNLNSHISFLGPKPHQDVAKIMDSFHCLILPMMSSILPSTVAIKILEGVIKGKIIITNNCGNNKLLFKPYYDLILSEVTAASLAQLIKKVIQNYSHYLENAEKIRDINRSIRSKAIYSERITNILFNII